jgi:hypothetical protein
MPHYLQKKIRLTYSKEDKKKKKRNGSLCVGILNRQLKVLFLTINYFYFKINKTLFSIFQCSKSDSKLV